MIFRLLATACLCGPLLAGPAAATGMPDPTAQLDAVIVERVELSDSDVSGFVASLESLHELEAKHPELFDSMDDDFTLSPAAQADFERAILSHGFADEQRWHAVAQSVFMAFHAIEEGMSAEDVAAQVEEMRSMEGMIAEMPGVPDDQKAMMLEEARRQMEILTRALPSAGNIEAVRPYMGQLRAAMAALE